MQRVVAWRFGVRLGRGREVLRARTACWGGRCGGERCVPFDTTIHYISVHLHPFAESLELRDLTTGKSVFKSMATNSTGSIGLDHVEFYSGTEGIPLYKDHEYTLISVYDNDSGEQQDAMAVMFLYMRDQNLADKYETGLRGCPGCAARAK